MAYISNGDIDDEDMADITDWTDSDSGAGASTQVTFDSKSCMKLTNGTPVGGQAFRSQDIGTFGTRTVFSLNCYFDLMGVQGVDDAICYAFNGSTRLMVSFASNGIFVYDDVTWNEVGTNLVVQDVWQEWTFDIDWTAQTADVYLDKVLKASDVDCSSASATANGTIYLAQNGSATANCITYIDWFKAGSGFTPNVFTKTLTETFISADTIIKSPGKNFLENIKSNDLILKAISKTFLDIPKISDTIQRNISKLWLETAILLEVANKAVSIFFEEVFKSTDNMAKGFARTFTDTILSNDTFSQFLKWLHSSHIASVWGSVARTVSTWAKQAKSNTTWTKKYG